MADTRPILYLNGSNYRYWAATTKSADDAWHHWCVYLAGALQEDISSAKLYIDTEEQTTGGLAHAEAPAAYTSGISIGKSNYFFDGTLSDFRIYNRELTSGEITQLYNGTEVSSGLTNHWLFDDETGTTATDSAGSSNGTLTGGPLWSKDISDLSSNSNNGTVYGAVYAEGQDASVNGALSFNGTDDYVIIPYSSVLKLGNTGSISLWFKPNDYPTETKILVSYGGFDYANGYLVRCYSNDSNIYWKTTGGIFYSYNIFTTDEWTHLVVTNDNGLIKMYADGSYQDEDNSGGEITNNYSTYIGGSDYESSPWSVNGSISDVRIYNRALTDDEVMAIYMGTD